MEMEMEVGMDGKDELSPVVERLAAAALALEEAAGRMASVSLDASSLDAVLERVNAREAELAERLTEAEATIASLRAEMSRAAGRRTEPCGVGSLVAREGRSADAGALDSALKSLSVEQRIAVKAEMMRGGLLG